MLGGYIDISFSYDEHLERFSQATRCDLRGSNVHVSSSGFARDFLRTENDADGSAKGDLGPIKTRSRFSDVPLLRDVFFIILVERFKNGVARGWILVECTAKTSS